jgi:hypothetical protein
VRIFPVETPESGSVNMPRGRADRDGHFTLTTYEFGDGAPAGEYVVTIIWRAPLPGASPHDEVLEYAAGGPDQLEGRYADPATSPLRVTIKPESNELAPFDVY